MVSTGITVLDECVNAFNDLKMKKTYRYLIFKINGTDVKYFILNLNNFHFIFQKSDCLRKSRRKNR
jgi:hypothetical protein